MYEDNNVMKMSLKELQEEVTKILKITIEICDRNKITYYCHAGTVLGAIRHGGPIPWDYDADIIIPNNQIDNFINVLKKELPNKYYVDYYTIDNKSLRQFPRIGLNGYSTDVLHLDVFRLIGISNQKKEQEKITEQARIATKNNKIMRMTKLKILFYLGFKGLKIQKENREKYLQEFNKICNLIPYSTAKYVTNPSGKYGIKNIFNKNVYGDGRQVIYSGFTVRIPEKTDFYLKQYYGDYMKYPSNIDINKEMNKVFEIEKW